MGFVKLIFLSILSWIFIQVKRYFLNIYIIILGIAGDCGSTIRSFTTFRMTVINICFAILKEKMSF